MATRVNVSLVDIRELDDGPAQEALHRTQKNIAQRVADETREELDTVLRRVTKITDSYDKGAENVVGQMPNVEYLTDVDELEAIIKDQVKKKKYQQQVTVFVIGYQDVCATRLKLVQQISDFLTDSQGIFDTDFEVADKEVVSFEEIGSSVEESIESVRDLSDKLSDLNKEIVEYLQMVANSKASNKQKRKLEKALESAKADTLNISEKLLSTQEELNGKEEQVQNLIRQLELKNMEAQKFRTAAEMAKKSVQNMSDSQDQMNAKDADIKRLEARIQELEFQIEQAQFLGETDAANAKINDEANKDLALKLAQKDAQSESGKREVLDDLMELRRDYEQRIGHIEKRHQHELLELKRSYEAQIRELKNYDPITPRAPTHATTEFDENAVKQWLSDEEGSVARMSSRSKTQTSKKSSNSVNENETEKRMAQLQEEPDVLEFSDQFDLNSNNWNELPRNHVLGRFKQYRSLTVQALGEYESKVSDVLQRTSRKVQTLKAQFQDHKGRWERERQLLVTAIDQTEEQKKEAQEYAEKAVEQMEQFVLGTEKMMASDETENSLSAEEKEKALHAKVTLLEMQKGEFETRLTNRDAEYKKLEERLMQQTDDAITASEQLRALQEEIAAKRSSSRAAESVTSEHERSKAGLEELKSAAGTEEGRSGAHSAAQSVHSIGGSKQSELQETVERLKSMSMEKLQIDEDGDMPFPPDASRTEDIASMKGMSISEHPVVREYVSTYQKLMDFKSKLGNILLKQEIKEQANELLNTEMHEFDKDAKVLPQVETMGQNVSLVLDQIIILIQNIVVAMDMSSKLGDADSTKLKLELADLHTKYDALKQQMDEKNKKYEEQLNSSTVMMKEMQSTISSLRRELTELNDQQKPLSPIRSPAMIREPTLIFTRVDSERNTRTLKKAMADSRLDPETYEMALAGMSEYTKLPGQRLAQLAHRYLHEETMRNIAQQVQQSGRADPKLLRTLDRMEQLEEKRTRRYGEIMDYLTAERLRLANTLLETFEDIEERSSIFLIKPTLSLRSRDELRAYYNLLQDKLKKTPPGMSPSKKIPPTPQHSKVSVAFTKGPPSTITGIGFEAADGEPPVWSPGVAQQMPTSGSLAERMALVNTPRLLELDINRMLLSQNNISMPYEFDKTDKNPLTPQNAVRSYVTVARPAAQPRTRSLVHDNRQSVPPSTPSQRLSNSADGRLSEARRSKDLNGSTALPPISPTPREAFEEEPTLESIRLVSSATNLDERNLTSAASMLSPSRTDVVRLPRSSISSVSVDDNTF